MKKSSIIFILIVAVILIYGFIFIKRDNKNNIFDNMNINKTVANETEEDPKDVWEDNNPIILGLYSKNSSNKRVLFKEYSSDWKYHTDIITFNTMYTNEDEISTDKPGKVFNSFLDNYDDISNYRIGYNISFETNNGNVSKQIMRPSDTESFYDYLEVYLYDTIYHVNDSWYSHTTEKEYNENTLLEAIKLTAGVKVNDITSDITLTVFTYDSDDFDDNGIYKGNSKYTVIVKRN